MPITNRVEVNDKKWREIVKEHKQLNGVKIKNGYFGNGDPSQNIAYLAAIQTYGIPKGINVTPKMRAFLHSIGIHLKATTTKIYIPQRPFMQKAMDANEQDIIKFIDKNYVLFLQDKISLKNLLNNIGIKHVDQIKNSITKGSYEGLHPVTVARKGSTKPLVGKTGELLSRVQYKVEK